MSAIDEKALAAATAAVTSEIDRYWKDDTVEPGHGLVAEAAVSAYLAALAPQQAAPMPVTIIHGSPIARFVQSYQFDASDEGIVHTPTHDEQCMIEDAICSFISDERLLHEALGITPEAGTSEPVADHGWLYFNEDTGTEWSPNHPVESGEVPDATQVRPCSEETRYWIDELVKRDAELLTLRTTHPAPAQPPVDGEAGTSEPVARGRYVDWLWWGEDETGLDHVSFGRWQKHPCQHRYTYAKPQATEHDHPALPTPEAGTSEPVAWFRCSYCKALFDHDDELCGLEKCDLNPAHPVDGEAARALLDAVAKLQFEADKVFPPSPQTAMISGDEERYSNLRRAINSVCALAAAPSAQKEP